MDLNMQLGSAGTDIMELCSSLPDLDDTVDISEMIPFMKGDLDSAGPAGSLYADLPSPETAAEQHGGTPDSTPDSEMSVPSSPELDGTVPQRKTVWSTMSATAPMAPAPAPPAPRPKAASTRHVGKMTFSDIEARRLERLNKNKKAAQALRRRKKQYLQQADADLRRLKEQNTLLRNKVSALAAENEVLRQENVFYADLFSKRPGAAAPKIRPAGRAGQVALGIMAVTMVVTLAFNANGSSGDGIGSAIHPAQRRLLAHDDFMDGGLATGSVLDAMLVPVPIQPVVGGDTGTTSPLVLPCSEDGSFSTAEARSGQLALPCGNSESVEKNSDVDTLLQLLQQSTLVGGTEGNASDVALDWNSLAQLGSALYNDRTYLFAPTFATKGHAHGLLARTRWASSSGSGDSPESEWRPSASDGHAGGAHHQFSATSRQLVRKSSTSFPAQAQAMAVTRVQAVIESLSPIEMFFLKRILAYERDGVLDIEGMQQETVDWTDLVDNDASVSILMPTPDDDTLGIIELDCAVTAARRWRLAMPIAQTTA